ncbi:transcriptional regulator of acetoin/glycerol metabolism [Pseudacidovorax sp. 1753]|uniref:helix-turn-helix domain-containing protein n=1 Tax=unclassified Pseudacidovorax TaxID=2620592 RepID=UPI001B3F2FA3|nr:helix-turn-helix domain-containing protein [Pseudacidovorax sp.]MBP6894352.1 Fis family transcriptional regulator [Pseudacidovorax sp.]
MPTATLTGAHTPRQLFATTPEERTAQARTRFFDEGDRPSGLVAEEVLQSWMRCRRRHENPGRTIAFDPVTPSRLHGALSRNRALLDAAATEIAAMEGALSGTDCRVILTDREGVLLHVTHHPMAPQQPVLGRTARLGVNLAESVVGTTAPGIVLCTGQASTVEGGEHYFDTLRQVHCAAAPIRGVDGRLAGVLDLSVESRRFGFDAGSMVGLYATVIENRLLARQSGEHLVLRFQASPALLGTPLEAMAGVSQDGRVAWLNTAASRLLGPLPRDPLARSAVRFFGRDLHGLLRLGGGDGARPLRLTSGLGVWAQVRLPGSDGLNLRHGVALSSPTRTPPPAPLPDAGGIEPAPATLRGLQQDLIERTLQESGGNIARAARQLGVSRGTLYRRLRQRPQPG